MAGSINSATYISDDGESYNVRLDKSNADAMGFTSAVGTQQQLPNYIQMRYVLGYFIDAPRVRRKLYVGNPTMWQNLMSSTNPQASLQMYPGLDASTFNITFLGGEAKNIYSIADTALDDSTNNPV